MGLMPRDFELLQELSSKVPCYSLAQCAGRFFGGSIAATRKRVKLLERAGLVWLEARIAHPLLYPFERPLIVIAPGDQIDAGSVAYSLRARFSGLPLVRTFLITITKAGANLVGASSWKPLQLASTTHDLHVAEIYRQLPPARQEQWILDPEPLGPGVAVPDALLRDCGVEMGGIYQKFKIDKLLRWTEQTGRPLAIW